MPKERIFAGGAVGSALVASVCCFGPLLLAVLGLGGGALLLKLAPYRPFFLIMALILMGPAFYLTYRDPTASACMDGGACGTKSRRNWKIILWFLTAIVGLAAAFPFYAKFLF